MKRLSVLAAVEVMMLMVHARGFSATGASVRLCEPDCTFVNDDVKVADPNDCFVFYYCNNGLPYGPVPCGSGHFDPDAAECVAGDTCEPICGLAGGNCPLTCNDTLTTVGDAFDCNVYYWCISGEPSAPQYCPEDRPHYDGNSFTCVNDKSVCCRGYCYPYCDGQPIAFLPDPKDCSKFYLCSNEVGIPSENLHFHCNIGEYFSVQLGDCVDGPVPDPCPTLCDAATAGGNCPLTCNDTLLAVGDAYDCSTYYICTPTGPSAPQTCPVDRPHYDGNSLLCLNDESVCCGGYCYPYCNGSGPALVPDPKDCSMYYACGNNVGIPDWEYHFACDAGGYFSVQAGECVQGPVPDPCPTLCDAA